MDVLARQISQYIADHINAKMAKQLDPLQNQPPINVTARMVRRHLLLCVNSLIENPSFDSQMKECLTSSPENFGSSYELPDGFLRKLVKPAATHPDDGDGDSEDGSDANRGKGEVGGPGIVEEVLRMAVGARQVNVARLLREVGASGKQTKRQVLSIPKLEDANLAGGERSADCTLILTEGDSAKALAVAGLEVVSRDKYGVFPLRGKFLNVRNVTVNQLAKNAELKGICAILGLQFDKTYETRDERRELRYGHVMLMTDQDADGSHIKGASAKGIALCFCKETQTFLPYPRLDNESLPPFLAGVVETPSRQASQGERGSAISVDVCHSAAEVDEEGKEKGILELLQLGGVQCLAGVSGRRRNPPMECEVLQGPGDQHAG